MAGKLPLPLLKRYYLDRECVAVCCNILQCVAVWLIDSFTCGCEKEWPTVCRYLCICYSIGLLYRYIYVYI